MSRIIIGVHGLGNKPPKELLEKWWKQSIREGLCSIGKPRIFFNFELVYWADVFHPLPSDPEIIDEEDPCYLEEMYWPAKNFARKERSAAIYSIKQYLIKKLKQLMLNEDKSLNYSYLADKIIHRYFNELEAYYAAVAISNHGRLAKDVIRERLADTLYKHRKERILLIGHSMGSLIAYDVLTQTTPDVPIDMFITIGSPLGLPVIISKIYAEQNSHQAHHNGIRTPENVRNRWFNFSDVEDNIAIDHRLNDDFQANRRKVRVFDKLVYNNYRNDGKNNPHKIYGYLRTPEMAKVIYHFLNFHKPKALVNVVDRFNFWFSQRVEKWQ